MRHFEKLTDGIFCLSIPFEDLFTAVYLIRTEEGDLLADTGTTEADVRDHILPALRAGDFSPRKIFISHRHGDHDGGLPYLASALPGAQIFTVRPDGIPGAQAVRDGDEIAPGVTVWQMPGHTAEMAGLFCHAGRLLLSFDALQQDGISRFGTAVSDAAAYLATLARVEREAPVAIIASHDYAPHGGSAAGAEAVTACLSACRAALSRLSAFVAAHPELTPADQAALFNRESGLPRVPAGTFAALRGE